MRFLMTMMVAMVCAAGMAQAQYSTDFEVADLAALQADGWVFEQYSPNLVAGQGRNGSTALQLQPRVWVSFPLNGEFGTLNLWVYDEGLIPGVSADGFRWGLAKGDEAIAAHLWDRPTFLPASVCYAANHAYAPGLAVQWWSSTWFDAGVVTEGEDTRSRGVAGWMNWEIGYYPDGTIIIDCLSEPNRPDGRRSFGSNTPGVPALPHENSIEFNNPATGGADSIYLFGSWNTVAPLPFGDMLVDDVTWTPMDSKLPGDANLDCKVDLEDFVLLKTNFGTGDEWGEGDFNGDGIVDLADFVILKQHFGETCN